MLTNSEICSDRVEKFPNFYACPVEGQTVLGEKLLFGCEEKKK